jgi:hypothetical protein
LYISELKVYGIGLFRVKKKRKKKQQKKNQRKKIDGKYGEQQH